MNKRKILMMALALCMVAILAVGGSLAYFMDTDNADNVFTIGDVSIILNEEQRDENGDLEEFVQEKELFPVVGNVQAAEDDENGLPSTDDVKNYVDKIITVTNDGTNDAYIRVYFAIPSALDDGYETFNAMLNVMHFNFGNYDNEGTWATTYQTKWDWKTESNKWNYFETTMDGIAYNVYFADYMEVLPSGETTEQAIMGVYLDAGVNFVDKEDLIADGTTITTPATSAEPNGRTYQMVITQNGTTQVVDLDFDILTNGVVCPVFALGVQDAGFDTPDAAFDAAFGTEYNPWNTGVSNWQN